MIAMRIKLIDSCKVLIKTVPGSVPIVFNEFKYILLSTIQVRESMIIQKEQKIKRKNILATRRKKSRRREQRGGERAERRSQNQTKEKSYLCGISNIFMPNMFYPSDYP